MAIGQSKQRLDAEAKVTGRARYTDDLGLPGMRHAVFVRSSIAHGMVTAIDAAKALALPGVEAVFTADDVPDSLFPTAGHPYSMDPARGDVADRQLLTRHVRYYGDEVAVVVARDELTARKAAALVKVSYDPLPVMTSAESALAPDAPLIQPAVNPKSNLLKEHTLEVNGRLEEALSEADLVIEGEYSTPTMQHCHLENQTAYAYMDDMRHIVVVSSTQIPHICRRVVGQALNIPWSSVRVVKPFIGGGFGNKQDVVLEPIVAFLTLKLDGAPVSMALTREECILCTRVRHAFAMKARAAVTRDGKLLGYGLDVLSNTGAYASHGHSIAAAGGSKICYVYPHATYRFSARTFYSNIPVGGACRGYGSPQTAYGIECLMDDAARALGMDPLDFRLKNTGRHGDLSPLNGKPIVTLGISDCLEQGRALFRWDERRAACRAFNEEAARTGSRLRRGVGVSAFSYGTATYPVNVEPGSARLTLNQDGTVHLMTGSTEIGQGADTAFAQMVSETLGLSFENIHVISTQDTDVTPWDPGAYASRQTYTCAPAVHQASEELRRRILEHAGAMTGHFPAALTIAPTPQGDAVVFVRQPQTVAVTLRDLAMDTFYDKDRGGQLSAEASVKSRQNPPSFGACFVEAEVDLDLCKVTIRDIINIHDAGVIINPALATAQVHGGMGMGIGWALYEELLIDPETGRVHNNNLLDYKFPTTCDLPDLGCAFVETQEPSGAYGNKSLGEPPLISPAPALRNAVLDATGVAVNAIPMTPKRLFEAFGKAGLLRH
ncbi:MAG TPA: xanthine dehydrogenase molybdenum-binding subunit XdhA [Candidatus Bilophila faecipullorum]|uniref:Xanthine dehydrogenase molybdenum-binding subunit XdhA n=2 Tax=Bilophila TaxID=35832 RepID=A0A9D1U978_9BACT|nr:xanthine dehydrogenase subunit XdhA [uncultured Bilophila sp.]HIW77895.1 xanthine dehydrogenase molybdenum-binding subunit XdhA [Candidatus Bilophila faecipullorum]